MWYELDTILFLKSLMNLSFFFFSFFLGGKDEELDSDDLDDSDNDDDEEEVEEKEDGFCGQAEMKGTETLDSLKRYMDQMDEELMKTNVGQSFKRTVNSRNTPSFAKIKTIQKICAGHRCHPKPIFIVSAELQQGRSKRRLLLPFCQR